MINNDRSAWENVPSVQNDGSNAEGREAQEEFEKNRYGYGEGGPFGRGTLGDAAYPQSKWPIRAWTEK